MRHSIRSPQTGRFVSRSVIERLAETDKQFMVGASNLAQAIRNVGVTQTTPRQPRTNIVNGRLYGYRGIVVRAFPGFVQRRGQPTLRHVSFHKMLFGYVPENELYTVSKEEVQKYLDNAETR